jgi:hypothetical protein
MVSAKPVVAGRRRAAPTVERLSQIVLSGEVIAGADS